MLARSGIEAILVLLAARLAVPVEAGEDDLKTSGAIRYVLDTSAAWPPKVASSFRGNLDQSAGPLHGHLEGSLWPLQASRALSLGKTVGPVHCTLDTNADWPPKPVASISGAAKSNLGKLSCSLTSPAIWPPKLKGTIQLDKNIGAISCKLKSKSFLTKAPKGDLTLGTRVASFDCSLTSPVQVGADSGIANVKFSRPTATISRSVDTPIGKISGGLESSVGTGSVSLKAGSVSLKQKIGLICYNLEAKSTGDIRCTFDTGMQKVYKGRTTTTPPPPAPWWSSLFGQRLDEVSPVVLGTPAMVLIGFLVGSGLTLVGIFRPRPFRGAAGALM